MKELNATCSFCGRAINNLKNIIVSVIFSVFLISMFTINIVKGEDDISKSERRKLQTFPKANVENILNGDFFSKFDILVTNIVTY